MTAPLGRLLTAMITPMTPSGEVDIEGVKRLAQALVASGTEGIVSTGSTGEAAALSEEETIAVWRATKAAVGPDVAVLAGATNNNHRASLRLTREAVKAGLDGVLLTVPAYSKPPQAGLVRHFTALGAPAPGRAFRNRVGARGGDRRFHRRCRRADPAADAGGESAEAGRRPARPRCALGGAGAVRAGVSPGRHSRRDKPPRRARRPG